MENKSYRIILMDDHPAILQGVENELTHHFPHAEFIGVPSPGMLYQKLEEKGADLIYLDYEYNGGNALDVLPRIRAIRPGIPVIMYTMHDEPWIITMLIKAQVQGIVIKGESLDDIGKSARSVLLRNEKYYSQTIYRILLSQAGDQDARDRLVYRPSPRELEVINLLSLGYTSEKIADKLCLSKSTVESMRKNILSKSNASNVSHLIRMAFMQGWIQ